MPRKTTAFCQYGKWFRMRYCGIDSFFYVFFVSNFTNNDKELAHDLFMFSNFSRREI